MTPKLIISPEEPYTRREIMEEEQSELWKRATECVKKLSEVQKRVVELLPECRKLLPTQYADLQDETAQRVLLNHIHLRSLYAFSNYIYKMIEEQYKELADCSVHGGRELREAEEVLQKTLDIVSEIPFDNLINDTVTGLLRINKIKERLREMLDFMVYSMEHSHWSFRDIIGTIVNHGLTYDESLWRYAIGSQDPTDSNIKELLDDDEL